MPGDARRVLITGGGTGGHIYPALAIAGGLRERYPGTRILYMGSTGGLEADLVPGAGYDFVAIPAQGLQRKLSPANLTAVWRAVGGYRRTAGVIRDFAPHAAVGTGGYVCGPVILAAARRRIPTFIHEQNALPGLTNRLLSRYADRTAVSFPEAAKYFSPRARVILTGLPVRPEILNADRKAARAELGLAAGQKMLLSFGGSQGARSINRALADTVVYYADRPGVRLYHATGPREYEGFMETLARRGVHPEALPHVTIAPYFYEIATLMAAADLVVARAGASTLAELTVLGRPAILIPYPFATGNHQEHNAQALVDRGAAVMIPDADLTGEGLRETIAGLLADPARRRSLAAASKGMGKPRALDTICGVVKRLADGQG